MSNSALTAITVLGGLLSATLSLLPLFPLPGLPFFSYFCALPLFMVGLGVGLRPLYGAILIATLIILIFANGVLAGEFFIFSGLGPAYLIYRALLNRKAAKGKVNWYPTSLLLRDLTYASAFVMVLALGGYVYLTQGKEAQAVVATLLKAFDPQGHMKEYEPFLIKIFPFLPGFFAFSWSVMMLINASLAQGLLVRFQRNLRPTPSFKNLDVPKSFLIALGLSLVLSFVGVGHLELLGKNAAFVLVFPFFLVGLSLVHRWLNKTSYATVGLTLFYFVLILFLWPVLFVILLGILNPWIEKAIFPN